MDKFTCKMYYGAPSNYFLPPNNTYATCRQVESMRVGLLPSTCKLIDLPLRGRFININNDNALIFDLIVDCFIIPIQGCRRQTPIDRPNDNNVSIMPNSTHAPLVVPRHDVRHRCSRPPSRPATGTSRRGVVVVVVVVGGSTATP